MSDDQPQRVPMTQERLAGILLQLSDEIEGGPTAWEFVVHGTRMLCVTDAGADRMRIISPIATTEGLPEGVVHSMLEANFHSALDARYATSEGIVYAAFIHPLSPLDEHQVRSALVQVVNLVRTFGTSYTSTGMVFGNPN